MNLTMVLQEENARLQKQYDDCQTCKTALEVRLKDQTKELKTVSGDSADSVSNLSKLQQKMAEEQKRVEQLEKAHKNQFDAVEKDNEKLTKEMLKHLRRADQLSETVNTVITILLLTLFFFCMNNQFFLLFQFSWRKSWVSEFIGANPCPIEWRNLKLGTNSWTVFNLSCLKR